MARTPERSEGPRNREDQAQEGDRTLSPTASPTNFGWITDWTATLKYAVERR